MDQDPVVVGCRHRRRLQSVADAFGARGAAATHGFQLGPEFRPIVAWPPRVVRRQHHPDAFDRGVRGQRRQSVENQRPAEQVEVLFRLLGAEARAAAGSGNDCVMSGHGLILTKNKEKRGKP
ncbi:hypothetical protein SDC9_178036 [bioreactor metagenome]|uniref:Uncharacterized protein n=1 Tax=bioreactor metagenome TaxID=1076179 RepID=A0A645GUW0_9ZZZZ